MKQRPTGRPSSSEKIIRDIKRKTRKQYGAEEKIRIVLDGLRGADSIAELCRESDWSGVHLESPRKHFCDHSVLRPGLLLVLKTLYIHRAAILKLTVTVGRAFIQNPRRTSAPKVSCDPLNIRIL